MSSLAVVSMANPECVFETAVSDVARAVIAVPSAKPPPASMFPSTSYFASVQCPFAENGLCQRPYCHFKHVRKSKQQEPSTPSPCPTVEPTPDAQPSSSSSGQTILESLVQEAVKKVLASAAAKAGEGEQNADIDGLLKNIDAEKIAELLRGESSKSEASSSTISKETVYEDLVFDSKGRRLFLPDKNAPSYSPTPISKLKTTKNASPSTSPYIPTGLSQVSSLKAPVGIRKLPCSSSVPSTSRKRVSAGDVLGDIGDLSESNSSGEEDPNVLGSILVQGSKSGIFSEINEVEHEVIRNKVKISSKRNSVKVKEEAPPANDVETSHAEIKAVGGDEEVFASDQGADDNVEQDDELEEVRREQEAAKRVVEQKEAELRQLEQKRKVLENFYKNRQVSTELASSGDKKPASSDSDRGSTASRSGDEKRSRDRVSSSGRDHTRSRRSGDRRGSREEKPAEGEKRRHSSSHSGRSESERKRAKKGRDEEEKKKRGSRTSESLASTENDGSEDDADLPPNVRSFLEEMNKLDEMNRLSYKSHRKKDEDRKSESSRDKGKGTTSEPRKQHSSRNSRSSHRGDSKDERKSRTSSEKARSSRTKEASKSSKGHSSSVERAKKQGSEIAERRLSNADSPLPDISEELDMLPDELDEFPEAAMEDDDNDPNGLFDDGDDELRQIFDDYKPDLPQSNASQKKARAKATAEDESSSNANRKRMAHANAPEKSASSVAKRPFKQTPSQMLIQRYSMLRAQKQNDDLEVKMEAVSTGKRVAHASDLNPDSFKSKLQKQLDARREATESDPRGQTVAHTIKGFPRLAHQPTNTAVLQRPIISDSSAAAKIPANVRQRYLNSIVDECLKIYKTDKARAYERAISEEEACCSRSKNRNVYLNVVVNCIKKLRDEAKTKASAAEPVASTSGVDPAQKRSMLTTHLQVLAGKGGSVGTWSIEKRRDDGNAEIVGALAYALLKRYVLTQQQLEDNCYPLVDSGEKGRAVVKEDPWRPRKPQPADPHQRNCDRCLRMYQVDETGHQVEHEECVYHWGRLFKKRGNRATGYIQTYSCCQGEANSEGCQVHKCHVTDVLDYNDMRGFMTTLPASKAPKDGDFGIFALDCEMCNTVKGNELTRVTVVGWDGKTVYESLVKPSADIIDYNTRFSGITEEDLADVTTTIHDVQAVLLSMFTEKTILIGHSLESDMKALKMIHQNIVDTSIVFPHKMGPPYKRSLKVITAEVIKRLIQNDVGGHDSAEDALACLDLMKLKIKEDAKKLQQMSKAPS